MVKENMFKATGAEIEKLSPDFQEISDMDLHYDDVEFDRLARSDTLGREVSEDAFLKMAKMLVKGENPTPNTQGAMSRILERDSMKESQHIELFKRILKGFFE